MGWSTIPKVITAVKAFSKTGGKSVGEWKLSAAKAKLKMVKENLTQTFKKTDKELKKFKTTVKKQKKIMED
jgi:hypothetical protein